MFGEIPEYNGIGIYSIQNTTNGKYYVGSSKCVHDRLKQHISALRGGRSQKAMQSDFVSGDDFVFSVLEKLPEGCTRMEIYNREWAWSKALRSFPDGYNRPIECPQTNQDKKIFSGLCGDRRVIKRMVFEVNEEVNRQIREAAQKADQSVNQYVLDAVRARMEREQANKKTDA